MQSVRKVKLVAVFCLILCLTNNFPPVVATDSGNIIDVDIEQAKKELNWYGITGIQITLTIHLEFIVQVAEDNPNIFFSATVTKSGSTIELSEAGQQSKIVTNNTRSTIEFEMVPLMITATGKSSVDDTISLKKGDKMLLSLKMYYYPPGEVVEAVLDVESETFYLLSGSPTNTLLLLGLSGVVLISIVILIFVFTMRSRK